ncbi:MAG: PIN domain-containing protein [Chloroflexi bacterium]|nr:PIN domain-containing protein [Chloroflexota bacterium]MBI5350855.1 PIN domain-containing protein [Chloroflexota bacterium]MBI5712138.1 PIN domain-containing protein [Chloroflexota bacterium]
MAKYVTDTHSLFWYFTRPKLLSEKARAAFAQVANDEATLVVPAIVLAELIYLMQNKPVGGDLETIIKELQENPAIELTDLTTARVLDLRKFATIPEMHDRLIAAEAVAQDALLITRDDSITKSNVARVVW